MMRGDRFLMHGLTLLLHRLPGFQGVRLLLLRYAQQPLRLAISNR